MRETAKTEQDRRAKPRELGRVFACILEESSFRQFDQAFCVVMDVSEGGMRVRTPQPPLAGAQITLRVALGDQISKLLAHVVRVEEIGPWTYDVGLSLILTGPHANGLLEAIRNNQDEQPGARTPREPELPCPAATAK